MQNPFLPVIALMIVTAAGAQSFKPVHKAQDTLIIEHIFSFQEQHCHGSTLVELPNKDLLAAWFQGSGERTADDVVIKGARKCRTCPLPGHHPREGRYDPCFFHPPGSR